MTPCSKCICKPLCREKYYIDLFRQCSIVRKMIPNYDVAGKCRNNSILSLYRKLKPNTWHLVRFRTGSGEVYYINYIPRGEKDYVYTPSETEVVK